MLSEERGLYPLKFMPVFKEKVWGGNKIKTVLNLNYGDLPNCGEAWMLSGLEDEDSVVANGFLEGNTLSELVEVYMGDLVGEKIYARYGLQFPILVKWIDARENLSVQVHPDDALAMEREGELGKSEMWYVQQADPGAEIICGVKPKINQMMYLKALKENRLLDILNTFPVKEKEAYYIEAGTIHALKAGTLVAEIQQSSDITYRIYDWERKDSHGHSRPLHLEQSLKAIKFDSSTDSGLCPYCQHTDSSNEVLDTPYFQVNYIDLKNILMKDLSDFDSFVIYICTEGRGRVTVDGQHVSLVKGEVVLIPACSEQLSLVPSLDGFSLLEVSLNEERLPNVQ